MRKPRPEDFDPKYRKGKSPKPENVDLSGVVEIKPRKESSSAFPHSQNKHSESPQVQSNQSNNIGSKQPSNIAILQFSEAAIEELREAAYKAQTFRFSETEIEWIKDTAHLLSKEMKRGKVAQVDILRIGLKLFSNALLTNKRDLLTIIERMK
jgi:hypothetical protein